MPNDRIDETQFFLLQKLRSALLWCIYAFPYYMIKLHQLVASRTIQPSSITPRDLEHILRDETVDPKPLPLSLLKEITDGFSHEQRIGKGGFAVVYKGKVHNRFVAVKRMSDDCMDEKLFHQEVQCLMIAKHKNVVRFLGYCADRQGIMKNYEEKLVMADIHQRLLCFEYLPKGSLREYITDTSNKPCWRDYYQIITGICQGLHYLHQNKIAHLDLKPENILLDDTLVAKIADFGLSRCFMGETGSRVISKIGGTPGYWAPEIVGSHTQVKNRDLRRLDIYSLGVVILEILTGKNCNSVIMEILTGNKQEYHHIVDNVVESWSNMVEQSQRDELLGQVRVCAVIGIECINRNPKKRPDTQRITNRLDGTETMDEYIKTGLVSSQQAENARSEQPGGMPNSPGQTSSKAEHALNEQDHGMPNLQGETSSKLVQKDLVFTVKNEQGYALKLLRDQNNLHGSLVINGLNNVTSRQEALEANLAAKVRLTELELNWDATGTRCSPEVEADVLEVLCPPVGLKKLNISCYKGSRYPYWMRGKQNGGPKDLQELKFFYIGAGPAPQLVEAFPNLRVLHLSGGDWDALPSNMEHLTSLKRLTIWSNYNIRLLPTLPQSLEKFYLYACGGKFMKSCQTFGDPNWQKLMHIPKKTFGELSFVDRTEVKLKSFWGRMTW